MLIIPRLIKKKKTKASKLIQKYMKGYIEFKKIENLRREKKMLDCFNYFGSLKE
jgi:hypothetical protein